MNNYQRDFIQFCISNQVLRFGEFTLKSGRISPFFFNMGAFNSGATIARLGQFYADTILDHPLEYDQLFGPAYKGIPLVTTTAIALSSYHGIDKPYAFNRKETKSHGEGGSIIGAPLHGKILIIDDVITAGTAINQAAQIIQNANAQLVGVIVAIDRQERGQSQLSAIQEIEQRYAIKVSSIINMDCIDEFLHEQTGMEEQLAKLKSYRSKFGVS